MSALPHAAGPASSGRPLVSAFDGGVMPPMASSAQSWKAASSVQEAGCHPGWANPTCAKGGPGSLASPIRTPAEGQILGRARHI